MEKILDGDSLTRLAACAAAAIAAVYAGEALCRGKDWPLWRKYGPWLQENRFLAAVILAAAFYKASLSLCPKEEPSGYIPCP